ncbi:MAG: type III secretion system translocon subunit SctE [Parachlamydiales bacterium]|nr:type III secretion system translocon subunit SctE [Parachlamydiales bacterium]
MSKIDPRPFYDYTGKTSFETKSATETAHPIVETPPIEKPYLARPISAYERQTLANHAYIVGEKQHTTMVNSFQTNSAYVDKLKEQSQKLREDIKAEFEKAVEKMKSAKTWGIISDIASALSAAFSIALGIGALATGGGAIVGSMLIATGVMTISNLLLNKTGVYDRLANYLAKGDKKQKAHYLKNIQRWTMVASIVFSVVTFGVSFQFSAAVKTISILDILVNAGQGASQLAAGTTSFAKGVREYQRDKIEAGAQLMESQKEEITRRQNDEFSELKNGASNEASILEQTLNLLSTLSQICRTTLKNTKI